MAPWTPIRILSAAFRIFAGPFTLLLSDAFLCWWLLWAFLITVVKQGIARVPPADFTISVFAWRQGDYEAAVALNGLLSVCLTAVLGPLANRGLVRRFGAPKMMLFSFVLGLPGAVVEIFAPFSPGLFLGPTYFGMLTGPPLSAVEPAFLSERFRNQEQAKAQSLVHVFQNLSTAAALMTFAKLGLYDTRARGWAATTPFLVGFIVSTILRVARLITCVIPYLNTGLPGTERPQIILEAPRREILGDSLGGPQLGVTPREKKQDL